MPAYTFSLVKLGCRAYQSIKVNGDRVRIRRILSPLGISFPFLNLCFYFSKRRVYIICLATRTLPPPSFPPPPLPFVLLRSPVDKTLKWLSSLPILMQNHSGGESMAWGGAIVFRFPHILLSWKLVCFCFVFVFVFSPKDNPRT